MTRASLLRRLLAGTAGLGVAVAGALTFTGPVHAATSTQVYVDGGAECLDPEAGEWRVNWTVSSWQSTVRFPNEYQLLNVEVAPAGVPAPALPLHEYRSMESTFAAAQPLGPETAAVTLTVEAQWNNLITRTTTSLPVERPEGCDGAGGADPGDPGDGDEPGEPGGPGSPTEPAVTVSGVSQCDSLSVTVTNHGPDSVEASLVADEVTEVVTIEAGGSGTVTVNAGDGTLVTVTIGDVDRHIRWEQPEECAEDASRELPVTGGSTALVIAGAVTLLSLGAGLYLLTRRRRIRFTA